MTTTPYPVFKAGQPVDWATTDGAVLTLTPQWSSVDGESLRVSSSGPVDFTEADAMRLHDTVDQIMEKYRCVWPIIPEIAGEP